jgi:hypothetical protein
MIAPGDLRVAVADSASVENLSRRIERECPRREPGSADELGAQQILAQEFARRGLEVHWQKFQCNQNLYAVIGFHQAWAVLGSCFIFWYPWVALTLHLTAAVSYWLDAYGYSFWSRRLLRQCSSQNMLAYARAKGPARHRVVLMAHADAAPTGWLFHPHFLRLVRSPLPARFYFFRKHMAMWMLSMGVLAVLAVIKHTTDLWWFPGLYLGLTVGSLIPLMLIIQLMVTNHTVAGANDNLSGCVSLVALADRFASSKPADLEVVFAVTGCEETGRNGATALVAAMRSEWDPANTTVIALDSISGGVLRYHVEGEVYPLWPPDWLVRAMYSVAEGDHRFDSFSAYHAPAGATDAAPFHLAGYPSVCLARVCPIADLPTNYHVLADCCDNLDTTDICDAVDFTEHLVYALYHRFARVRRPQFQEISALSRISTVARTTYG